MTITDVLFDFLIKHSTTKKTTSSSTSTLSNIDLSRYLDPDLDIPLSETELTAAEIENTNIHLTLLKAIASLASIDTKQSSPPTPITTHLVTLESFLTEKLTMLSSTPISTSILPTTIPLASVIKQQPATTPSSIAPSWLYLHTTISLLETLKATNLFLTFLSPQSSTTTGKADLPATKSKKAQSQPLPTKETVENLHNLVEQLVDVIRRNTRFLKMQIAESGMLGELVEWVRGEYGFENDGCNSGGDGGDNDDRDAVGEAEAESVGTVRREIEELMDTASLELFCASLMESWDESLDGVLGLCAAV